MCRAPLIAFVVALLCCAAPAVAQDPPPSQPPQLEATLEACAASALPAERMAGFVGSMPPLADPAIRMSMRFDLQRRRYGARLWRTVRRAPGFGVWERAEPGVAGFVFHKRVDGLHVPLLYRALVRFRWQDGDGAVVRRATRRTAVCRQPDLRPDLVPGRLTAVLAAEAGQALYELVVRNTGFAAAGPFSVRVGRGSAEVPELAAGQARTVSVLAPVCIPGSRVGVRADADRRVEESDERDNLRRQRCPLALG